MNLIPPKPPAAPSLPWCLANRAALGDYFQTVRALGSLGAIITNGGTTKLYPVNWGKTNALVNFTRTYLSTLDPETLVWLNRIVAAGGTFAADSVSRADQLIRAINATACSSKIVYLLPLLGADIIAARVPLRDTLGVGIAGNTGFVNADFSEATGLQGGGSSKTFDLLLNGSQLGAGNDGGVGYWETNISFAGTASTPIGYYDGTLNNRYDLDLRATLKMFQWGVRTNWARDNTAAANGHYYGQRSATTLRTLYYAGSSLATDTTNDASAGITDHTFKLMGCNEGGSVTYWAGRCAVCYLTDGTLTAAEVAAFHTLLQTYLITPTGR